LMVGIFEFGYVVFAYNTLSNAVREGARYGSVQPADETGILERAKRLTIGLDQSELGDDAWTVEVDGGRVSVSVEYEHTLFTGFLLQAFGGDTLTLRAASSMGVE